jgi:hypothetical protein
MEFDVQLFETFLDYERTKESEESDSEEKKTEEGKDQMDTANSHIGEDEATDLLQSILQYQAKFLICHVETKKSDKQTTKKMIINNLILNMRKKTNEFTKCIIPNVLKGKQRLVDKALEDNITQYTYQSREPIREKSKKQHLWKYEMSAPDKLQSIAWGHGFSTFTPLDFSRSFPSVTIPTTFSLPTVQPFMRLQIHNITDAKGQLQSVGKWLDNKNFLQELFENITIQVQSLEKILTDIRVCLDTKVKETEQVNTSEDDEEIATYTRTRNTSRQQHVFLRKKDTDIYSFSLADFFLDWKPEFLGMHVHFQGKIDQPSISQKMVYVDCCFEECLQLFDKEDEQAVFIMRHKINEALTCIMTAIRTSSLNIAIVGTLSHNEFAVCDVLKDPYTKQLYSSGKEMAEYVGSQHMALIAQAGIAYFDMGKIRRLRSLIATRTKREKDEDGSASEEPEDDKLSTQILSLVTAYELPKLEVLQKMLKNAFAQLESKQFLLLQSILQCLWTLQEWTRPLDYHEERRLNLLDNRRGNTIDLTQQSSEFDTEAKKKVKGMIFKKIKSTSTTVPSARLSSSGEKKTVQDGSEIVQTPASRVNSKNTPNITPKSSGSKSSKVMSDSSYSLLEIDSSKISNSNRSGTRIS